MESVRSSGEIVLDDPLAADSRLALFSQLAPRIRARVVERARIKRILGHRPIDVIMTERDVVPLVRAQLFQRDLHRRSIQLAAVLREHALDFSVQQEDVVLHSRIGLEARSPLRHVRYSKNSDVEGVEWNPPRLSLDHCYAQLTEQTQDAARLAGARRVVVPRDHDDPRFVQHLPESLELNE